MFTMGYCYSQGVNKFMATLILSLVYCYFLLVMIGFKNCGSGLVLIDFVLSF